MARGAIGAVVVGWFLAATAHAALQFTRIADTSTAAPGGNGTFTSFDPPSSNREALPFDPIEISFRGVTSTGVKGIYRSNNSRVVDSTMPMPGFSENYGDFISVSGGPGLWSAVGAGGTNMGVYSSFGVSSIAKTGDVVAGVTLNTFGTVSWGNYSDGFYVVYEANNRIFNGAGTLIASNA